MCRLQILTDMIKMGFEVQETILGERNGKTVVACRDFLKDGERLVPVMGGAMPKIRGLIWDIPVLSDVQKKFYDAVMERRYEKVFLPLYRKMMEKREESAPERKERGR